MRRSILALVSALALSAPASASTVRVQQTFAPGNEASSYRGEVVFRGAGRERNRVQLRLVSGRRLVVSDRVRLSPGRNCRRLSRRSAMCRLGRRSNADNFYGATVRLGAGSDRLRFRGDRPSFYNSTSLSGGPGNDELLGSRAELDTFDGGSGNDRMLGGEGQDIFEEGRSANGRDTLSGGGGSSDLVDYSRRRSGVRVDLAGDRDDGQSGERDKIGSDVDNVNSGRGNDVLSGNGRPNAFHAGAGADEVTGGGGIDRLVGDDGDDRITAADGGSGDELSCGRGTDTAQLDANDIVVNLEDDRCERVTRQGPAAQSTSATAPSASTGARR